MQECLAINFLSKKFKVSRFWSRWFNSQVYEEITQGLHFLKELVPGVLQDKLLGWFNRLRLLFWLINWIWEIIWLIALRSFWRDLWMGVLRFIFFYKSYFLLFVLGLLLFIWGWFTIAFLKDRSQEYRVLALRCGFCVSIFYPVLCLSRKFTELLRKRPLDRTLKEGFADALTKATLKWLF